MSTCSCFVHYNSKNNTSTTSNIHCNNLISSIFKKLPNDSKPFHLLSDKLIQTNKFKPSQNIKLLDCHTNGPMSASGQKLSSVYSFDSFLGSDNKIYLCGDRVWEKLVKNDRRGVQEILLKGMVHFYDRNVKGLNFYNSRDYACSEIRGFSLAKRVVDAKENEKQNRAPPLSISEIFEHTEESLRKSESTKYLNAKDRVDVIANTMENCLKDKTPFDDRFRYESFQEEYTRRSKEGGN